MFFIFVLALLQGGWCFFSLVVLCSSCCTRRGGHKYGLGGVHHLYIYSFKDRNDVVTLIKTNAWSFMQNTLSLHGTLNIKNTTTSKHGFYD
jgi:hypothetical protein